MPLIGKTYTTLLLGLLLFVLVALSSPTEDLEDSSNIPGRYVIQFKPGLSDGELKSQIERNTDIHNENLNSNLTSGIRKIIRFSSRESMILRWFLRKGAGRTCLFRWYDPDANSPPQIHSKCKRLMFPLFPM